MGGAGAAIEIMPFTVHVLHAEIKQVLRKTKKKRKINLQGGGFAHVLKPQKSAVISTLQLIIFRKDNQ